MTTATEVRDRPILFSAPMVRAILDGKKTQTRRVLRCQPLYKTPMRYVMPDDCPKAWQDCGNVILLCPYGVVGDRLWVRETFTTYDGGPRDDGEDQRVVVYREDPMFDRCGPGDIAWKWSPSIFMPRWASRITLEITNVRVERLNAISDDDAYAEGIPPRYCGDGNGCTCEQDVVGEYGALWDSLNASRGYGWDVNPWVWVLEFRRVEAPDNPLGALLPLRDTTP